MTGKRRPAAFRVDGPKAAKKPDAKPEEVRKPRAVHAKEAELTIAPVDVFDEEDMALSELPPAAPPRRRSRLGGIFWTAFGALVSLAVGLWADRVIRDLFSRAEWLGWVGVGLAAIAALALIVVLARELFALARLSSIEKMRANAETALSSDDPKKARALVDELAAFVSGKPDTAAGRRTLAELRDEVIDGSDLIGLAEKELLAPLDARAQKLVLDAAKRVSLITAVSPRAVVDVAYVAFESGRLIRRLAELYGGRPGTLGFLRLARNALAHLAVTGSMAVGDSLVQQLIGHGLAARLSAKLGEGIVNGMMTARIGIAAMEIARPLPFHAVKRPGLGDFLSALTSFTAKKETAKTNVID